MTINVNINKVADPRGQREKERLHAQLTKQAALLDYVATMADVELPEEELTEAGLEVEESEGVEDED